MEYRKYTFKNVSWIGPNILSDFAKSTYSEEERRELWRQDLTFIRDPDHPPYKRYVLVSNYVGGEEDVVDEPDTYEACFALQAPPIAVVKINKLSYGKLWRACSIIRILHTTTCTNNVCTYTVSPDAPQYTQAQNDFRNLGPVDQNVAAVRQVLPNFK